MARVLIVEDYPAVLRLMVETVRGMGYEVVGAESVARAKAIAGPWNLLVIDFGLPNGDGMEVAHHWPTVPALFVSGGVNADLRKPFTTAQLREAVQARLLREEVG